MSELGPFFPNPDGKTLIKNPYSWNQVGETKADNEATSSAFI